MSPLSHAARGPTGGLGNVCMASGAYHAWPVTHIPPTPATPLWVPAPAGGHAQAAPYPSTPRLCT